jgi:threonine synthase
MEKSASASKGIRQRASQQCIASGCAAVFDVTERLYVCPRCRAPLEVHLHLETNLDAARLRDTWNSRRASANLLDRSGVWRFRELLPLDDSAPVVTLFEGNTPLYDAPRTAEYCGLGALQLKHQGCNPTGSFKDTGMTVAITHAKMLGARTAVCASTGNTAASLAAYSARAGLQCAILVPRGQISAAKLAQSMDYGAVVCELDGNFDACMALIQELGEDSSFYVANSINPFRIEGQKTVAFEMMEQLAWHVPDHLVVPGGNLGNSSALGKGLRELLNLGLIDRLPKLHVIQAEGAAPFARMFAEMQEKNSADELRLPDACVPELHPRTLATAIKIGAPVSWQKSLRAVLESRGRVISVTEQEIADAKAVIGRDGIGCEPASATTAAGIRRLVAAGFIQRRDNVLAVLTGHVLKDPDYVSKYHGGTLSLLPDREPARLLEIKGKFENRPIRVASNKYAILEALKHRI